MTHSTVSTGHDLRPHPTARAGPPVSAAGRWWVAATVLGVPFLIVAVLALPGLVLADRLPAGMADDMADDGLIYAAIWAPIAAVAFTLMLRAQFRRVTSAPAAPWGWVVPAVYMGAALFAGPNLARVLTSIDTPERPDPAWSAFAIYGSMILGVIVGSLLAQRVVDHLPRAPVPRARSAWVEAVPAMGTLVIGYSLAVVVLGVGFMAWVVGTPWFGLAVGMWTVALVLWTSSVRVALTPSGVRVTKGAFGLVATTRSIPLADVAGVEAVDVSRRQVTKASFWCSSRFYAFRPGPALQLTLRSGPTVTVGLRSHTQARQVADLLITWQLEQSEAAM
jgi:hypothetical protein